MGADKERASFMVINPTLAQQRLQSFVGTIASHTGPESCVATREGRDEALTGGCVGQPVSGENQLRGADVLRPAEGNTARVVNAKPTPTPRRRRTWPAQALALSSSSGFEQ